jgi:hypothetical protein
MQSHVNDVHIVIVVYDDDDYYSLGEDFYPGGAAT